MGKPRHMQDIRTCAKLTCRKAYANPPDCDFRFCKECRNGESGIAVGRVPDNGRTAARRTA